MTAAKTAPEAARPPANADELKAAQAPLKAQYREQADSAVVTFRAEGRLDEGIACKVDTGRALVEAGLHPAAGGTGTQACSGDMLLEALAACTGVTLNAVATAIGFKFAGGRVIAGFAHGPGQEERAAYRHSQQRIQALSRKGLSRLPDGGDRQRCRDGGCQPVCLFSVQATLVLRSLDAAGARGPARGRRCR